jgi:hypothetical protein
MGQPSVCVATIAAAMTLSACGGGGGGGSDARCSDFTYQEDAQAALRAGASQLDGDSDGIACESLPHRPASAPPPAPAPAPAPPPPPSAAGLWRGTTNTGRTVNGLVLPGGTYYVLYSMAGDPNILGGVVQGTSTTTGSSFSSSDAKDFNAEGAGTASGTVSASVVTKQTLNGSISLASGGTTTFTTAYSALFELTPSLAAVAGTYSGQAAFGTGFQTTVVTVLASGAIQSTSNGCSMTGTATPRSDANAFNVSMTFGAAPCHFAGQTLTGIAYYDLVTKRLYAAAPNAARSDGVVYLGVKP